MVFTKLKHYGELVMFSHTLFSLPFALLTMIIAANGFPQLHILIWGIVALVGARTGANAWNRIADAEIDLANPRTAHRHLPQKIVANWEVLALTVFSYLIYFFAAFQINNLALILSPIPIVLFTIYPYTKRFTWLCHFFLGFCCALAVFGSWIAIENHLFDLTLIDGQLGFSIELIPTLLFIAVLLWNAGFDIIYGSQDIEHDRQVGLFSIPQTFGLKYGLLISKVAHLLMICLLAVVIVITPSLGSVATVGLIIATILLIIEHSKIDVHNRIIMKLVSYRLNQIISVTIFIFYSWDVFIWN
ncbi:MAG: UbiA-like polyprenyltransferase [Mycoplasmatales bacterium]